MRPKSLPTVEKLAENKPHGNRVRYMAGCRCLPCRASNSTYEVKRAAERRKGNWNGLVPANKARRHILKLSKAGVGRHSVADAAGVPYSTIARIRSGERKQIRAETEKKILSVTEEAAFDNAYVDAAKTKKLISKLYKEGFTKQTLAKRLGYKHSGNAAFLQYPEKTTKITPRNALKVEKLYNSLMVGGEE